MAVKVEQLSRSKTRHNATSSKGRQGNEVYRVREHLAEAEIEKLLTALKQNRYGQRDWLIGLLIYRHGLRVSEACDLRGDDIDLTKRTIIIRRSGFKPELGCCVPRGYARHSPTSGHLRPCKRDLGQSNGATGNRRSGKLTPGLLRMKQA